MVGVIIDTKPYETYGVIEFFGFSGSHVHVIPLCSIDHGPEFTSAVVWMCRAVDLDGASLY